MPTDRREPRPEYIQRFTLKQRIEHWVFFLLFTTLLLTGFPQKFYETGWAGDLVRILGGLDFMRWVHRMTGIGFSLFVLYFLTYLVMGILKGRIAASMIPFPADLIGTWKSLLGNAGLSRRPVSPHFNFQQKFEFWGLLFGGLLMTVTGLMLFFPIQTARWLPGQFIPAAKTAHSYEAMLAVLVIVLWHLYNVSFSPAVFPLDKTMIHGKISVQHLKENHFLEFERIFPIEEEAQEGPHAELPPHEVRNT